jgi:hypothetical protein
MFSCNKNCKLGGVLLHHTLTHMSFFLLAMEFSVLLVCPSPFAIPLKADKPETDSLHTEDRNQKAWGLGRIYSHLISK